MHIFYFIRPEGIFSVVKIRLMRFGKKGAPTYRIVAADSRSPRDGRFIEILGIYNPVPNPPEVQLNNDKAQKWLNNGAQPTDSVQRIFKIAGFTPTR